MVRTYSYRVDVYRNGARLTSIKAAEPPQITASAESEIKSGLSGVFYHNSLVDYLDDELRPVQIIDGKEYTAGVFHVARYTDAYTQFGKTMRIEAYDKCYLLKSTTTETVLHLAASTSYLTAIEQLMVASGIKLFMTTPNASVLATDREDWPIGTDYLTIVNELLGEINYDPVWFNSDGYAVLRPTVSARADNIQHAYSGLDVKSVLSHDCTASVDIWDKPNVFIAVCQNPDLDAPMIATAVNDSPGSSISTYHRGRRIARTYKVKNIADQDALQEYVNNLRNESMLSSETLTIYTANMPSHGIGDTVSVQHPKISGVYREIGWSLTLAPGQLMQHDLQRKVLI